MGGGGSFWENNGAYGSSPNPSWPARLIFNKIFLDPLGISKLLVERRRAKLLSRPDHVKALGSDKYQRLVLLKGVPDGYNPRAVRHRLFQPTTTAHSIAVFPWKWYFKTPSTIGKIWIPCVFLVGFFLFQKMGTHPVKKDLNPGFSPTMLKRKKQWHQILSEKDVASDPALVSDAALNAHMLERQKS